MANVYIQGRGNVTLFMQKKKNVEIRLLKTRTRKGTKKNIKAVFVESDFISGHLLTE